MSEAGEWRLSVCVDPVTTFASLPLSASASASVSIALLFSRYFLYPPCCNYIQAFPPPHTSVSDTSLSSADFSLPFPRLLDDETTRHTFLVSPSRYCHHRTGAHPAAQSFVLPTPPLPQCRRLQSDLDCLRFPSVALQSLFLCSLPNGSLKLFAPLPALPATAAVVAPPAASATTAAQPKSGGLWTNRSEEGPCTHLYSQCPNRA